MNRLDHILQLDESERQLLLMALAHLANERPGFDHALTAIAQRIDNPGPQMYNEFKRLNTAPPLVCPCTDRSESCALCWQTKEIFKKDRFIQMTTVRKLLSVQSTLSSYTSVACMAGSEHVMLPVAVAVELSDWKGDAKKVKNTHATSQSQPHNEFVRLGE